MTQQYLGQIPDPARESGPDLAARLNAFDNAHRTNQAGPTRPANILAGGVWSRVVAGVYEVMLFDGSQDRVIMRGSSNLAGLTNLDLARANLGLKALATKDKVAIDADTTGTLPVNRGGTGGTTAAAAREGIGISAAATIIARLNAAVVHSNAAWAAGTATTGGLPSPKQIADAIAALALGVGQEWRRLSAVCGTNYQNVKERPIQLMLRHGLPDRNFSMSQDGIEWDVELPTSGGAPVFPVVPSGWFWRVGGTGNIAFAWEMS